MGGITLIYTLFNLAIYRIIPANEVNSLIAGGNLYLGTEAVWEAHPENDIALLEDVANESILVATAGCFGVFFPWDAHRPALYLGDGPATSRKCVIKISMDLFDE